MVCSPRRTETNSAVVLSLTAKNVGTNELIFDPVDILKPPKLRPICDGASLPVKKPWALNGAGRKQPKPPDPPEFVPYKKAVWSFRWATAEAWAA